MTPPAKKTIWRTTSVKIIALLLGYTFWYIFGHSQMSTVWITVPLYFYNVPHHNTIKGPDTISLKVTGKRSDLRSLDPDQLAIHVNAEHLSQGKNLLPLTQQSIFLPESIKLVHYCPSNPTIELLPTDESLDG